MIRRRIDDWSSMRLDGILAWIHRLVMLVTFPLRRFWLFLMICLAILAILLIIPLYNGVPFGQIGSWYKSVLSSNKISQIKNKALADAAVKFEAVEDTIAGITEKVKRQNSCCAQTSEKEKVKLVAWPVAEFKRAQYHPKIGNTKDSTIETINSVQNQSFKSLKTPPMRTILSGKAQKLENRRQQSVHAQEIVPASSVFHKGKLTDYYEQLENRNLIYIQKPDILYGKAEVSGPNSLSINGVFFFLYGIYTDAQKHDPAAAERYLQDITAEAPVYCAIVAYAANTQAPTALCFVNGIFINRSMVNHNLADNIGLK